ncbi:N-acetylmuramoyl-L-alanine amidase [Corynebacterium yudongzhengii]|uniref:N-acetylmuramoyl-L-alanine amidase n=1 Tax=Corynebacterium yudongzhengii TaxID=2080740 RepID=A0A2U1T4L8_9CORY|nr:N-acetylmuramoyl-L-alanine amidase [Corynebacterium yudongzhengii]AWB83070.1 N-acetylmuramoyl-L-alanine amidase [Corynebacterium yudongzhengii]PWC00941.1 N-acetylmuramoyl-L-alanine amidase [Corynebacterium yudongzhengii]
MEHTLRVGDSSARVAEARSTLTRLGYLSGDSGAPDWKSQKFSEEDKLFDAELAEVLKAFQQSRGILPSGSLDTTTLRELRHASYRLGARVLSYQPHNELVGDDVIELQTQLQDLGFYSHRVDGQFGKQTHAAVAAYQLNSGLQDDGTCGPDTLRALSLLGRRITGGSPQALREREYMRKAGPQLAGKRVVLDPALGGSHKGQVVQGLYGEISEEEILWDLATRVEGRMIAAGMETIISRPRTDDPAPSDRSEMANAFGADLMISLHCDRYQNEKANGAATFYFGSEIGANSLTGEMLSGYIQREIVARTELTNCGNHARTWQVLRLTTMPTVEVVLGYLTNPHDVSILTDPAKRDVIAEAIVVAVKRLYLVDEDHQPTGTYHFTDLLRAEGV